MKYLKTYENFKIQNLLETFDYEFLLENKKINYYKTIHNKTVNKWSTNLYFVGTFQMGVTVLYPIVEALVKNSNIPDVTPETIVLMTIFSIAQILNVFNEDVKKIKEELENKNLLETTKKIKDSLLSVYKIFSFISKSFGKIIDVFTDMLAYVSLCVPTALVITEWVSNTGINIDTLPQKILVFGGGAALFAFKSTIETLVAAVKNKIFKNDNKIL